MTQTSSKIRQSLQRDFEPSEIDFSQRQFFFPNPFRSQFACSAFQPPFLEIKKYILHAELDREAQENLFWAEMHGQRNVCEPMRICPKSSFIRFYLSRFTSKRISLKHRSLFIKQIWYISSTELRTHINNITLLYFNLYFKKLLFYPLRLKRYAHSYART